MKYEILQNSIRPFADKINELGWEGASKIPEVAAHLAMTFEKGWKPEFLEVYKHVATVETDGDLERVFHIMNVHECFESENVEKILPYHSLSVGDLVRVDGEVFAVAGCGFEKVS